MSEDSERPVPPRPRMRDPLWTSYETLSSKFGEFGTRLQAVEEVAKDAHAIASEARSKTDTLAAAQIQAQKDFTLAIEAQTRALTTFGTGLNDVKSLGHWLLVLIVIMSLGTFVTLGLMLMR